jgi:hypothetical protein
VQEFTPGSFARRFFYAIKIVAQAPELRTNKRELRFFERR